LNEEIKDNQVGAPLRRDSWVGGLRAAINTQRENNGHDEDVPSRPRLGQVLLRNGYVSDEDINRALAEQARSGKLIGEILIDQGTVSQPIIKRALEEQSGAEATDGLFSGLRSALGKNGPDQAA
jgi:hypothetical protein